MKLSLFGYVIQIKKCKHNNKIFVTNLFGDSINRYSTKTRITRSLWKCKDCGKIIRSSDLNLDACYTFKGK